MRPGQNRRMRGRNNNNGGNNNANRKSPNPLQRSYESNGPDVKVRGTAQHVAEKYLQLARDAQSSSDPVAAENYFQHAEHYYRILLAAQEQMAQQFGHSFPLNRAFNDDAEDGDEDGEEESQPFQSGGPQPDIRTGGAPRQDGEGGEGRSHGLQRFERQDRSNQDRGNQDRNNHDRNGSGRRFDRNDRGERRFERGEQGPNGSGGYAARPDAPRSDIPVPGSTEQPDLAVAPNQGERRFDRAERPERGPRPERGERRPPRAAETAPEGEVAAALPSFLTTPVRVPVAVAEEPAVEAPAPAQDGIEPSASDVSPKRSRGRRRSPREVMDALGSDADAVTE